MTTALGELGIREFLDQYWQKRPCLIHQAFPDFKPELDADDIAGLACDDMAESRLITGNYTHQDWTQRHGPFKTRELRKLPDSDWTLLVQDVEKHYPPLQSLFRHFDFIPSWRLDDLMVSVAAPGGSVGPHVDQYDVFLLQASGRRRWQIATHFDTGLLPDCELNILASFTPDQEWDVGPGDMLYLPPGVAHHGVALDNCMTWSIGLRAPSQADLLQALGEWLAERNHEGERYRDGGMETRPRPGEINQRTMQDLRALVARPLQPTPHLHGFLAHFLSRYRLAHQPAPPDTIWEVGQVAKALVGSAKLHRNPWTRLAWIEQDGRARLFAAGEEYVCSIATAAALCTSPPALPAGSTPDGSTLETLCQLINAGHLYLEI